MFKSGFCSNSFILCLPFSLWKVENPRDELAAIREAKNCEALEAMKEIINPDSLKVLPNCYIEKFAATLPVRLAVDTDMPSSLAALMKSM